MFKNFSKASAEGKGICDGELNKSRRYIHPSEIKKQKEIRFYYRITPNFRCFTSVPLAHQELLSYPSIH